MCLPLTVRGQRLAMLIGIKVVIRLARSVAPSNRSCKEGNFFPFFFTGFNKADDIKSVSL